MRKLFLRCFKDTTPVEYHVFACSLGLFLFSYITFFLGIAGLLYKPLFLFLLLCLTLFFAKENINGMKFLKKTFSYQTQNYFFLFFISSFILTLLISLSPSTYWDELHYHLTLPKLYLSRHKIGDIPELFYAQFPQTVEMLFLLSMLLSDDILPNLIHWAYGVLCALSVYAIGRRFYSKNAAILAAVIFFTTPTVMRLSTLAYIDLGTSLYVILSFFSILLWHDTKEIKYFFLSAVFCGISFSTKHSAVIGFILLLIFILKNMRAVSVKQLFLFVAICFLIPSPFYLKSLYWTGNPVYPFLYSVFGGRHLTASISHQLTLDIMEFGKIKKGFIEILFSPWNVTIYPQKFWGVITPVYLSFLPLIVFFKKDEITKIILFFGVGYLLLFFFLSQQIRFLIPSLALLSMLCSFVFFQIKEKFQRVYFLCASFVFFSFVFSQAFFLYTSFFRLPVAIGLQSKSDFLEQGLDIYPACKYVNEKLSQGSKIFFINDNRVYYCDKPFLIFSPATQFLLKVTPDKRYTYFKKEKVTHILYTASWVKNFKEDAVAKMLVQDVHRGYLKNIFGENAVYLFEIFKQ